MFDEAKIAVPTNQEEFIEAAKALTKDGKYGLLEAWDKASHLQDNLNRWCLMFGGNFYDWTLDGTKEKPLNLCMIWCTPMVLPALII